MLREERKMGRMRKRRKLWRTNRVAESRDKWRVGGGGCRVVVRLLPCQRVHSESHPELLGNLDGGVGGLC